MKKHGGLQVASELVAVAVLGTGCGLTDGGSPAVPHAPVGPKVTQVSRAAGCAGEKAMRILSPTNGADVTGFAGFNVVVRVCSLKAGETAWVVDNSQAPYWVVDSQGSQVIRSVGTHSVEMTLGGVDDMNSYTVALVEADPACADALNNAAYTQDQSAIAALPRSCTTVQSINVTPDNLVYVP